MLIRNFSITGIKMFKQSDKSSFSLSANYLIKYLKKMTTSYALAIDMLTLAAGPLANLAFNLSNILHLSAFRDIIILCLTRCFRQVRCIALTSFVFCTTNAAESIESASSFVTTPAFSSALPPLPCICSSTHLRGHVTWPRSDSSSLTQICSVGV